MTRREEQEMSYRRYTLPILLMLAGTVALCWTVASASGDEPVTRAALASQLGLQLHEGPDVIQAGDFTQKDGVVALDGNSLSDCSPRNYPGKLLAIVQAEGGFYCVTADTHAELFDLSQRLKGIVPSDGELDDVQKAYGESPAPAGD
jgi:hypothetical protein